MKRGLFLASILALAAIVNCGSPAKPAPKITAAESPKSQVAHLPPEVRLRKLHLVRPDLIQYPISYEVYC
ncbi:MAG TPA: hypothetical protein VHS31_11450 [Tepidisphaeraceae bacterium]|jgi:hypothetical protein|nr:hypothetical protein [Tepidisphaeraceae bacterium]